MTDTPDTNLGAATPIMRALAKSRGVDLSAVVGTGAGGRIRRQDVLDAAGGPHAAVASTSGAASAYTGEGIIDPIANVRVLDIDPFGRNPVLAALTARIPNVVTSALAGGPAPTMFPGGDLPPFTGSGIAPQDLLQFPWGQRHLVASLADTAAVYATLETYADEPDIILECPGLDQFLGDMRQWAMTSKAASPVPESAADYDRLFGGK